MCLWHLCYSHEIPHRHPSESLCHPSDTPRLPLTSSRWPRRRRRRCTARPPNTGGKRGEVHRKSPNDDRIPVLLVTKWQYILVLRVNITIINIWFSGEWSSLQGFHLVTNQYSEDHHDAWGAILSLGWKYDQHLSGLPMVRNPSLSGGWSSRGRRTSKYEHFFGCERLNKFSPEVLCGLECFLFPENHPAESGCEPQQITFFLGWYHRVQFHHWEKECFSFICLQGETGSVRWRIPDTIGPAIAYDYRDMACLRMGYEIHPLISIPCANWGLSLADIP